MSNHSSDDDPMIKRKLDALAYLAGDVMPGATGRFPRGQITPQDEGELAFRVGHFSDGTVILDFGKPVKWIGFTPKDARAVAAALLKHAEEVEAEAQAKRGTP